MYPETSLRPGERVLWFPVHDVVDTVRSISSLSSSTSVREVVLTAIDDPRF